jgi:hypothetical protein
LEQATSESTQPAAPVAASAGGFLTYRLGSGKAGEPNYGELQIEYVANAEQLVALNLIGECDVIVTATISCKTVIGGKWHAAAEVCAFAATALRNALGERAPAEIAVDIKALRVSCQYKGRTSKDARLMPMYYTGNHLLMIYTTSFAEEVAQIHPPVESETGEPEPASPGT